MPTAATIARRVVVGALVGLVAWVLLAQALPSLPVSIRFLSTWCLFTAGPGLAISAAFTRRDDGLVRVALAFAIGQAAIAVLVDLLGRGGVAAAAPFVAAALAGAGVALARTLRDATRPPTPVRDLAACAFIVALAAGTGAVAFSHRLDSSPRELIVYGDYDSLDLTYYASITSEATHTIPPTAPYYAGRELNYAYYPQLVLAMVHRAADVPVLEMYFGYAWPTWLAAGAVMAFVLVRSLSTSAAALIAVALMLVGGDLSYLAAWWQHAQAPEWDYVLWPTNFLAPTMEVLHFNSWTPSLPIFFAAIFGVIRATRTGSFAWAVLSGLLLAVLFQFKPFAFIVVAVALGATTVFAADWPARWRTTTTLLTAGIGALPFAYRAAALYADRRSQLELSLLVLPQRMLLKLGLADDFAAAADRVVPVAVLRRPVLLLAATALFLAVGPGVRWVAAGRIVRALRGRETPAIGWALLAWIVVAGVGIPFVIATEPYQDTLQFYQVGLYVWWIFTGVTLAALWSHRRGTGAAAIAAALVLSLPSSMHYLDRKWHDATRPPLARLSRSELMIADYLRGTDPERTVILHDRPFDPSLVPVVTKRRVVLAWARYAVGSDDRRRDVDAFFDSAAGDPATAEAILRRYRVTHVLVRPDRDHIHPDVLARLQQVVSFPDAQLYRVPEGAESASP